MDASPPPRAANFDETTSAGSPDSDLPAQLSALKECLWKIDASNLDASSALPLEQARQTSAVIARLLQSQHWAPTANTEVVDLAHLLFDLQRLWSSRAQAAGVDFNLHLAADLRLRFPGDQQTLEAILSNLIHHQITESLHDRLRMSVVYLSEDWLSVVISGEGPMRATNARQKLGTDLESPALTQTRALCETLGIWLELRCRPGEQAEACLVLPLTPAAIASVVQPLTPKTAFEARAASATIDDAMLIMDETVFTRLLDLAGPDIARELVYRFKEDLSTVQAQIATALPKADLAALRAASHVLIALAGTAGAHKLQADALAFNELAHGPNLAALRDATGPILGQISALIRFLDALPIAQDGAS
jgi:hypothetical protein